jgi:hypothetical protein
MIASIGIPAHFDIIILCYCFNTKEFCEINNENNNLFFYQILMNVQVTMADVHNHVYEFVCFRCVCHCLVFHGTILYDFFHSLECGINCQYMRIAGEIMDLF